MAKASKVKLSLEHCAHPDPGKLRQDFRTTHDSKRTHSQFCGKSGAFLLNMRKVTPLARLARRSDSIQIRGDLRASIVGACASLDHMLLMMRRLFHLGVF